VIYHGRIRYIIKREGGGNMKRYWNFMDGWVDQFANASEFEPMMAFEHVNMLCKRGFTVSWEVLL